MAPLTEWKRFNLIIHTFDKLTFDSWNLRYFEAILYQLSKNKTKGILGLELLFKTITLENHVLIVYRWNWCRQWGKKKLVVRFFWMGWYTTTIHRRDPTTTWHGVFCLLRFRPRPSRPSLVNLVSWSSLQQTILMPGLVRTPDRHNEADIRVPILTPSTQTSLQGSWITGASHDSRRYSNACFHF